MTTERPSLEDMTLRQLRRVASEYGVSRYSRMRKDQLLSSIQEIMQSHGVTPPLADQTEVEAARFDVGQVDQMAGQLAVVDAGLPDLPVAYNESRIVLMPRDPQWAYAYWDIPAEQKQMMRQQGGQQLALRIYDVTGLNLSYQAAHSLQEYPCDELAREWYLPIPVSDRDYVIDIGYRCADGRWLVLARSAPVHVPPVYPSDWVQDHFITVRWEEELQGKTLTELTSTGSSSSNSSRYSPANATYGQMLELTKVAEAQRVAGSIFGSMQHLPVADSAQAESASSYVLASGVGMWASGAGMTASGMGMAASGVGMTASGMGMIMSGVGMTGYTMSGIGMSGIGMSGVGMSGIGSSASAPPIRPRQFWLVADAELIVYGATEPDACVTVGGRPIQLSQDGTFRFQMSFQDGLIEYPILAVAADGEQNRAIHLKFTRETPEQRTNTKEDAQVEWLAEL